MDAEHYRRKARHYLMCAHEMKDHNARAALIELAAHWKQMAEANEHTAQEQEDKKPHQVHVVDDERSKVQHRMNSRVAFPFAIIWPQT
jgi:hypothetical protein